MAEPTGCPGINVDAFVQGVSGWLHLFARGLLLSPVIHNCGENVVEIVGYWIQVRLLNTPIDILFSFRFFFERRKRETDRLFRRIERCIIKVLRLMEVEIHLDTNCKKLVRVMIDFARILFRILNFQILNSKNVIRNKNICVII